MNDRFISSRVCQDAIRETRYSPQERETVVGKRRLCAEMQIAVLSVREVRFIQVCAVGFSDRLALRFIK
jgi:hypothetical protein